ncbi:MAG: hypothetical protein QOH60_3898 [Mycobacterium sp.]|jgi:hypothetical protein|nr:hypothetical protein [Mycobacterium sp.]
MTTWGQGSTRGGRKARAAALERDGYQCQLDHPAAPATHLSQTTA